MNAIPSVLIANNQIGPTVLIQLLYVFTYIFQMCSAYSTAVLKL